MFLVCGEALFDFFLDPNEAGPMRFSAVVGGSPFNVALGLARLDQPVGFLSALSTDFLGQYLAATLEAEGVSIEYLIRKGGPTTLSLVGVGADGSPSYAFYGREAADRSIEVGDLPAIGDTVSALHFGSYSLVSTPTADALAALAQREAGKRFVSVDPNVRLTVEPDLDVWRSRTASIFAYADLVKISEEDIASLFPGRAVDAVAHECLDWGAGLVVVTRGGQGAVGYHRDWAVEVESPAVDVIDTVGAGDTFQAALLCGLNETGALSSRGLRSLQRDALESLLAWSARAAATTCSRRGADLPTRSELPTLSTREFEPGSD